MDTADGWDQWRNFRTAIEMDIVADFAADTKRPIEGREIVTTMIDIECRPLRALPFMSIRLPPICRLIRKLIPTTPHQPTFQYRALSTKKGPFFSGNNSHSAPGSMANTNAANCWPRSNVHNSRLLNLERSNTTRFSFSEVLLRARVR